MDGFEVTTALEAAERGELFLTATGNKKVLTKAHFLRMRDGAILANAGHFNVEIDMQALEQIARRGPLYRGCVQEYRLPNGRRLFVLGEGRLVNLACAEGHPAEVMDMSFANQALAIRELWLHAEKYPPRVHRMPEELDREIARRKLRSMGVRIDRLTAEQEAYLRSWSEGT